MRKKIVAIGAKLVGFAVWLSWDAFYIMAGFIVLSKFLDMVRDYTGQEGAIYYCLFIWYVITWMWIGIIAALRGFKFVGKWEDRVDAWESTGDPKV